MTEVKAQTGEVDSRREPEAAISAAVALRIRHLRKKLHLSFDALAGRSGVSKGTLVQVEQGGANPSISTLCRLAGALGVSVADLVTPMEPDERPVTVVGPGEARQLWTGPSGGTAVLLAGTPGPGMLELWQWVLMPGEHFEASMHGRGTSELIHVSDGNLCLEIDGESSEVPTGATAVAHTDRPHRYRNNGRVPVRFTMVVHEPPASE